MLVITGPNMGGKSTYLRQAALIALLAQMGSFVPADSAQLPLIDRIFTRIGASDNLARGRSTFMVEMTETAVILNTATPRSLIVLDEIGRGTATYDGLALAFACASHIARKLRAFTLFATHYFELTELAEELPAVDNVHLDASEHGDGIVCWYAVNRDSGEQELRPAGRAEGRRPRERHRVPRVRISTIPAAYIGKGCSDPKGGARSLKNRARARATADLTERDPRLLDAQCQC